MSSPVAILIEDEPQIRRFVRLALEGEGWQVHEAETAKRGLLDAGTRKPDLLVVDLGLPDGDGLDLIRDVRSWSNVPIVVLSARADESDKIAALDAGADDYLTKPFGESELLARLRALLRRVQPADEASPISFGSVQIDLIRRLVTKSGQPIKLTAREYALLRLFIVHRGKVLTHRLVLAELWGPRSEEQTHYLHVYMTRLRQKLEDEPNSPKFFQTEPGIGYRFTG